MRLQLTLAGFPSRIWTTRLCRSLTLLRRCEMILRVLETRGYVRVKIDGEYCSLARYLSAGVPVSKIVDHKFRNRFDNRRANLRITDRASNNQNKAATTFSTLKGVEFARGGWRALNPFCNGGNNIVSHFLAYYNTIERHREALLQCFFMLKLD